MERWVDEIDGEDVLSDPRVIVHYPKILALMRWVRSRSDEQDRAKDGDSLVRNERYPGCIVRRLRTAGGSLVLTIPKDLADLYDLKPGTSVEIEPIWREAFRISKVETGR
jgi:hypothetical protein